jgi:hypothetical protein
MKNMFDPQIKEIPEEVVIYLRHTLDGIWQSLESPVVSFDAWKEANA